MEIRLVGVILSMHNTRRKLSGEGHILLGSISKIGIKELYKKHGSNILRRCKVKGRHRLQAVDKH